ncbi:MAG: HEAT repeat domain-containing protein [Gemmataceae bacterium]
MSAMKRFRRGFTLFQLLLILAILLILLALLLPALVKARMAALRMQGSNNLRQLGIATQNIADTFGSKMPPFRFHAATALGQIGAEAKTAVPALVKLLGDKKAGPGRRTVVAALGQMGPAAKDAVAALKEARGEAALRQPVEKALAKIEADR